MTKYKPTRREKKIEWALNDLLEAECRIDAARRAIERAGGTTLLTQFEFLLNRCAELYQAVGRLDIATIPPATTEG